MTSSEAAMTSSEAAIASSLSGEHIAKLLRTDGPVVSCVLLRAKMPALEKTENQPDGSEKINGTEKSAEPTDENVELKIDEKNVLTNLIAEISIDTTPKKSMVSKVLGGQFTFLGQYEDEGIVVMVRREQDTKTGEDRGLVKNPHKLQPPLHNNVVHGDILLMRVADDPEEDNLDKVGGDLGGNTDIQEENKGTVNDETKIEGENSMSSGRMKTNEEFFLNYTKEEYIEFASRTDILPEESDEDDEITGEGNDEEIDPDEREGDEEDDDEGEDGEYNIESDEDEDSDEEEGRIGMMNLILGQILKRFQEENGRGPDTHELLTMRAALAEKLGIDCIPPIDDDSNIQNESFDGDSNLDTPGHELKNDESETCSTREKRKSEIDSEDVEERKRVKFSNNDQIKIIENVSTIESKDESKDESDTSSST